MTQSDPGHEQRWTYERVRSDPNLRPSLTQSFYVTQLFADLLTQTRVAHTLNLKVAVLLKNARGHDSCTRSAHHHRELYATGAIATGLVRLEMLFTLVFHGFLRSSPRPLAGPVVVVLLPS